MKNVFLSLGGNLGNRSKNLAKARDFITKEVGEIIAISEIYETKAWGVENQPDFLNQVVQITTTLSPYKVLDKVLAIEHKMGRVREQKWFARNIDIDVLFYDQVIIESKNLILPHPHISNRNFVLGPLKDIAPDFIHPVLQKSIRQLFLDCTDELSINEYTLRTA